MLLMPLRIFCMSLHGCVHGTGRGRRFVILCFSEKNNRGMQYFRPFYIIYKGHLRRPTRRYGNRRTCQKM